MTARAIGWSGAFLACTAIWATVIVVVVWGGATVIGVIFLLGLGMVAGWLLAAMAMTTHASECPSCRADLERVGNCRGRAG